MHENEIGTIIIESAIEFEGIRFDEGFRADLIVGYLLNLGAALMKEGIVRAVNGLQED